MNNITTQGKIDLTKKRRVPIPHSGLDSLLLQPGDVLFNATNSPELVGKSAYFSGLDEPATFSNHFLRIRPRAIDGRYLARWLTYEFIRGAFHNITRQWVNQAAIDKEALLNRAIPLPTLTEQRRIADILDQADAARSKRKQSIDQVDDLMRSIFLDMFGSLDHASGHWVKVTDLVAAGDAIRTGPFGSQLLHSEFQQEGVAVLGIDSAVTNEFRWVEGRCISEAKYRQLKRYTVIPGDVLITIMGTCGRCAVVPDGLPPAINTKHLCCITLDKAKCLPEFLHAYFLWHPIARRYLERAAKGAIMSGLNMGIIKALPVPVISHEDQATFVDRQEACRHLRSNLRSSLSGLDELFASIRQRAFADAL
jgi:type I restriction enzyme, S subunit